MLGKWFGNFNPLRREGGDLGLYPLYFCGFSDFNPLRREGGDWSIPPFCRFPLYFNPLRREGGDHLHKIIISLNDNFNPLRREGGDVVWHLRFCSPSEISIHSAARAETYLADAEVDAQGFQSTPPRGRRLISLSMCQ